MKRALRTTNTTGPYHFVGGVRIAGAPSDLRGNVSECEITDEERESGVDVSTLVEE